MSKVLSILFLALLICSLGWGQVAQLGSIKGTVKDETGAVLPGATVIVTSLATGQEVRRVNTGPDGGYSADQLPVGSYAVAVQATGFARAEAPQVDVNTASVTNVPFTMHLGQVTTQVTVSGAPTPVQLSSPVMGETVRNVANLPMATQNFLTLLGLSTGAVTELNDTAALGRGLVSLEVNGQRASQNNYQLEGINANDFNLPQLANVPVPSPSAVAEFKTQTSLYDAAYGRNAGGNIQVALKSGTNKFHGDAFEFFRNNVLNANDFFLNSTGQQRPILKQNVFGGSLGGPIPKTGAYFFVNYQGTRQRSGVAQGTQLSENLVSLPLDRSAANLASIFHVPAASISPVSLAILNAKGTTFGPGIGGGFLIPSLTQTSASSAGEPIGLFVISSPGRYRDDNFVINADKAFGAKDKFAARWFDANARTFLPFGEGTLPGLPAPQEQPFRSRFLALSETHTFGPSAVNEFRFGFNRYTFVLLSPDLLTLAEVGATRPNESTFPGLFQLQVRGAGFTLGQDVNGDRGTAQNTFEWADTLSKTWGRHSFRFGGDITRYQLNRFNRFGARGSTTFSAKNGFTGMQNFLLGNVISSQGGSGFSIDYFRVTDFSVFIQDDWKATPRLTLNLGVRWEPFGNSHETRHFMTLREGINDNQPPVLVFPAELPVFGTPGVQDCTLHDCRYYNNVAPRFGFAWDPTGSARWAIRGGYGIYYARFSNQVLLQGALAGPFRQAITSQNVPIANPFPNLIPESQFPLPPTPLPQIAGISTTSPINGSACSVLFNNATAASPCGVGQGFDFFPDPHFRAPYIQSWNFTVERAFGKNWVASIGYVGNKGNRLPFSNQGFTIAQPATLANPLTVPTTAGPVTLTASTLGNLDARVPAKFQGYAVGRLQPVTNDGKSSYNSLQASIVRRFGNNYFQAAYTWSKSLDNGSGSQSDLGDELNGNLEWNGNPTLSFGPSDFDRPHRLVFSWAYDFPWFQHSGSWWKRTLLGGWGTNAVVTFQSGIPFTVFDSGGGTIFGIDIASFATAAIPTGVTRSQIKGHGPVSGRLDQFFNSSLILPASCVNDQLQPVPSDSPACVGTTIGNAPRNFLRAPFQENTDFGVVKRFHTYEEQNLEFRAEAFNLWNQVVFQAPGCTGPGACSFPSTDIQSGPASAVITSTANRPRILQFALKYNW